jgi:ribosomal protein L37AE/L43A
MSDSPRASAIYYCPFCAEEDLRPVEEPQGAWRCNACARVFTVSLKTVDASRIPGRLREEAERRQAELEKESTS